MTETLTKAKIEKFISTGVPAGKTQTIKWDGMVTGLGLRLRLGGAASWLYAYRPKGLGRGGPSRKLTLGQWPGVTLDAARDAARSRAGEIAKGADPAADLRDERNRERRMVSMALGEYESTIRRRKLVNVPTIMSTLRRGLAPLMNHEVDALTRKDLMTQIEALENVGKPGAATDLRSHSRAWLEWGVARGLVQFNVLAGWRRARNSRAERLEMRTKAKHCRTTKSSPYGTPPALGAFGGLVRLGLLTGMRRNELGGLRWGDVRDDRIVLAAHATKTGARHEIPVTATMRAVLTAQPRTTSDLVFPSSRTGVQMRGWTSLVDAAVSASGVKFRLHDLRRTVRTLMSRCGVAEDIAELAIGHVRSGLIGVYNKDTAWRARTDAFQAVSSTSSARV